MSTVTGKTSAKIDELMGDNIVSGSINGSGQLILVARNGDTINAGTLTTPLGDPWDKATAFATGDVVGYAGQLWRATAGNTNKPPALYTSIWELIVGSSYGEWIEQNPFFTGDTFADALNTSVKTGSPAVTLTSNSGEFETGTQALKVSMGPGQLQFLIPTAENIVRGAETIIVKIRAKLTAGSVGASLTTKLLQNLAGDLTPTATGVTVSDPAEGSLSMTTSWKTYTFTLTGVNAKPRAAIGILTSTAANSAIFLLDWVRVERYVTPPLTLLDAYPIGSIYQSMSATNPGLLFGGVWSSIGAGRVLVGLDSGDTKFDTVGETGGAETHVHDLDSDDSFALIRLGGDGEVRLKSKVVDEWVYSHKFDITGEDAVGGFPTSNHGIYVRGHTEATSSLQPYLVCYMFQRTA